MAKKIRSFVKKFILDKRVVLTLLAVLVLSLSLLVVARPKDDLNEIQHTEETVRYTVDVPSEAPIPDNYSVPDGQPLSIEVPVAGIKGFIQKVGIDQNQAVTAPNNVHLAGWFVDSVKPGEKGLSIIDGHVSGRSADGIFKGLPQVKPDDEIVITMGGGQKFTYKVLDTKTVPNEQAASVLFEQGPTISHQLNLITCSGQFDKASNSYKDRVIVSAALISDSSN